MDGLAQKKNKNSTNSHKWLVNPGLFFTRRIFLVGTHIINYYSLTWLSVLFCATPATHKDSPLTGYFLYLCQVVLFCHCHAPLQSYRLGPILSSCNRQSKHGPIFPRTACLSDCSSGSLLLRSTGELTLHFIVFSCCVNVNNCLCVCIYWPLGTNKVVIELNVLQINQIKTSGKVKFQSKCQ